MQYTIINGKDSGKMTLHTGVVFLRVLFLDLYLILIKDLASVSDKLFTLLFAEKCIIFLTYPLKLLRVYTNYALNTLPTIIE